MGISISFSTKNDAFADGRQDAETARILRRLADRIEIYGETANVIVDANGNTIGQFKYDRAWHASR